MPFAVLSVLLYIYHLSESSNSPGSQVFICAVTVAMLAFVVVCMTPAR